MDRTQTLEDALLYEALGLLHKPISSLNDEELTVFRRAIPASFEEANKDMPLGEYVRKFVFPTSAVSCDEPAIEDLLASHQKRMRFTTEFDFEEEDAEKAPDCCSHGSNSVRQHAMQYGCTCTCHSWKNLARRPNLAVVHFELRRKVPLVGVE